MRKDLNYILHHIFLLSSLPQKDDSNAMKGASLAEEVLVPLRLLQAIALTRCTSSEWSPHGGSILTYQMLGHSIEAKPLIV